MAQQHLCDNRKCNSARYQPESDLWKLPPDRKVLAVVDIERRQKQNVGRAHANDVLSKPVRPPLPESRAALGGCGKRERSEDEEVVVFDKPNESQHARG